MYVPKHADGKGRLPSKKPLIFHLRICSGLECVYRVVDARRKFGEHEKRVRVAQGAEAQLKKLELLSATPRATLTHFSCSPNFPRASITRYTHAKHEQILKLLMYLSAKNELTNTIC